MKIAIFFLLCLAAAQSCVPPVGTTVVTKTVTTTTTTSAGSAAGHDGLVGGNDQSLIRSTWEIARKNGNVAPKTLFRFLKANPEYQRLFKSFADVPQALLMKNGNFLAQAYTIAAGLNVVIQSLGSEELLSQELSQLGTAHFSRGAQLHMFEQFGKVFISVLEEELGSRFTVEAKEAYQNGWRGLVAGIGKSLKRPEDVPHPITDLTPRQITNVTRSWLALRNDRSSMVAVIFKKMFADKPSLQKAFATFGDVAISELDENKDFQQQVNLVADRLDNMFRTLDNTLQIMGQFKYMGHSHAPRGIDRHDFEVFVRYFLDNLASRGVPSNIVETYDAVLQIMVDKIIENLY